jgi:hypothetical protein
MLDTLTDKFNGVFRGLSGRGRISEENIREAMREVRTALLEADVNFKVVNDFTDHVIEKAMGQEVIKSLSPGQLMVKIVYDELVNLMGPVDTQIYFVQPGPTVIMMCGPAGLGQNTTCGKLAMYLWARAGTRCWRRWTCSVPPRSSSFACSASRWACRSTPTDARSPRTGKVARGAAVRVCRAAVAEAKKPAATSSSSTPPAGWRSTKS